MLINHRGVTFQGLNMDIGHLRHVRWVKDDDPKSQINDKPELKQNNKSAAQNRWIAYNKMRGQYASAMEHAAPEAFWVDKTKCSHTDENGRIQNPTLNPCAEGISAVKAIAIAQAEGQKIYTINKANAQTALAKLPIGGKVGSEIRNAVNAGKEVTVHEKSINKHGWKGFGYIVIDPETGAGAYIIEGSGNGGWLALANNYLILYGPMAWEKIRQDRITLQSITGQLNANYREAEHFLYALQHLTPEQGWLVNAIATEGYWIVKALSNLIFQGYSPFRGSPVTWDQLIAGLYGGYCANFGCAGIRQ